MKADLDRLMAARELDAIIVVGHEGFNPPRCYLTNGAQVTGGLVVKKRDAAPIMVANPMEVEEAKQSGLQVYTWNDMGWSELLKEANGDRGKAQTGLWANTLKALDVPSGKIGLYGTGAVNLFIELTQRANADYPDYEFGGESGLTLFDEAYVTKDARELERIRSVAARTGAVWAAAWDFIAGHRVRDGEVVNADGAALTIGDVKRFVRRAMLERELEGAGFIFAQGRDAGFPHSRGADSMTLQPGQSIVFDLFTQELGGGYHHDSTRTWCIGYAPDAVRRAYDDVMEAFEVAVDNFRVGQPTHALQETVQDYFEGKGHPTSRSHPDAMEGYVHGLGHGVGLNIHERPSISHLVKEDTFQVGNVISIEPGLYYPERGFGVRVEDLFHVAEDGGLVDLTDFRKDLVLPLDGV